MIQQPARRKSGIYLGGLLGVILIAVPVPAAPPPVGAEPLPQVLTLDAAVRWALQYSPELAAQRQQHGIAAAGVLIANTYPFNPVLENRIQGASGPASAGITNNVPLEHLLLWEIEVHGQRAYRERNAAAALSRTDWQIVQQEQLLAVRVIRAFTTLLYRQEKLRLVEQTLRFNEQLVEQVRKLMSAGQLRGADLILATTEVDTTRDLVSGGREALLAARYDLYLALGVVEAAFQLSGTLEVPSSTWDDQAVLEIALERRADLHARQAAVAEAESNLRLAVANRYGNPIIGPAFTYDPTRISMIGAQINIPLPVANTHRGEIIQRDAERVRAFLDLRQTEVLVRQEVRSALARLEAAQKRAEVYRTQILPGLRKSVEDMERLFRASEPGVDVLRVIDVRRKFLVAGDSYLDTLWRISQAQADLVAAVGAPVVPGLGPCAPTPNPPCPSPPTP